MDILKEHIRDIPDFPKKGIVFKDITPVLRSPQAFAAAVDGLVDAVATHEFDLICGIESRGFLFGAAMAYRLGRGFIPVRKPGKLPYRTIQESYALEYGTNTVEIHEDAVDPGQRVLVVDDLLATGGTAEATGKLIRRLGGVVAAYLFVVELSFLNGRPRFQDAPVLSLVQY